MKSVQSTKDNGLGQKEREQLDYSSVIVAYKAKNGLWRGFVLPYDITYEADTRKEVVDVLNEMIPSYEAGLKKYDYPAHLKQAPFSVQEDMEKFSEISMHLMSNLKAHKEKIITSDYYAEAKIPA